jgi:hypothetical protein
MVKLLSFVRCRPPSVPGFPDPVVFYDIDQTVLETAEGRSTCNPKNPKNGEASEWDLKYAVVAPGVYNAEYNYDAGGRLCFIINGGHDIPTILPAARHSWKSFADGIECHCSDTEVWPGSAGCLTIRKSQWPRITQHCIIGEKIKIEIKNFNG